MVFIWSIFATFRKENIALQVKKLIFATFRKEAITLHWKLLIFASFKRLLIALGHLKENV